MTKHQLPNKSEASNSNERCLFGALNIGALNLFVIWILKFGA
jgi:hypothetical protein